MDQDLSGTFDGYSTRKETSRCARCVKDKKGCDRSMPCNRCTETGYGDSCVYTGAILPTRRRKSGLHSVRGRRRAPLPRLDSDQSLLSSDVDADPVIRTPGIARRKKRPRSSLVASAYKQRMAQRGQDVDDEWFQQPPSRAEEEVVAAEPEKTDEEIARLKIYSSYTDIVTHLPVEIYRSTTFIRALDQAYKAKSRELSLLCRELKESTDASVILSHRRKIVRLMKDSKQDRAEALAEVSKLQTLVEGHISLLGSEVDKIENPQSDLPIMTETTAASPAVKQKKSKTKLEQADQDKMDIPIDDDEPIYCYCQRVSFGKMIACENEQCEGGEWFHFECLGWTSAPRGKWWCEVCIKAGLAGRGAAKVAEEPTKQPKVQGESRAEKRSRIREENRIKEKLRRQKLRARRQR